MKTNISISKLLVFEIKSHYCKAYQRFALVIFKKIKFMLRPTLKAISKIKTLKKLFLFIFYLWICNLKASRVIEISGFLSVCLTHLHFQSLISKSRADPFVRFHRSNLLMRFGQKTLHINRKHL